MKGNNIYNSEPLLDLSPSKLLQDIFDVFFFVCFIYFISYLYFFSRHINLRQLFNAKYILVEEQPSDKTFMMKNLLNFSAKIKYKQVTFDKLSYPPNKQNEEYLYQ